MYEVGSLEASEGNRDQEYQGEIQAFPDENTYVGSGDCSEAGGNMGRSCSKRCMVCGVNPEAL